MNRANSKPGEEGVDGLALRHQADLRGRASGRCQALPPATMTSPEDGRRKPDIMCSSVDLPAPFGPSRPVTPGPRSKEMSFTATTLPYQRETERSSMAGAGRSRVGATPASSPGAGRSPAGRRPRPRRRPAARSQRHPPVAPGQQPHRHDRHARRRPPGRPARARCRRGTRCPWARVPNSQAVSPSSVAVGARSDASSPHDAAPRLSRRLRDDRGHRQGDVEQGEDAGGRIRPARRERGHGQAQRGHDDRGGERAEDDRRHRRQVVGEGRHEVRAAPRTLPRKMAAWGRMETTSSAVHSARSFAAG